MKYLEDTLAEQCLSKTLYPNTKIIVTRKKVEGTLLTYTNELEVEVDFSDVDPSLLENSTDIKDQFVPALNESPSNDSNDSKLVDQDSDSNPAMVNQDLSKSTIAGRASRFFRKN
jgi:hypothetical protein